MKLTNLFTPDFAVSNKTEILLYLKIYGDETDDMGIVFENIILNKFELKDDKLTKDLMVDLLSMMKLNRANLYKYFDYTQDQIDMLSDLFIDANGRIELLASALITHLTENSVNIFDYSYREFGKPQTWDEKFDNKIHELGLEANHDLLMDSFAMFDNGPLECTEALDNFVSWLGSRNINKDSIDDDSINTWYSWYQNNTNKLDEIRNNSKSSIIIDNYFETQNTDILNFIELLVKYITDNKLNWKIGAFDDSEKDFYFEIENADGYTNEKDKFLTEFKNVRIDYEDIIDLSEARWDCYVSGKSIGDDNDDSSNNLYDDLVMTTETEIEDLDNFIVYQLKQKYIHTDGLASEIFQHHGSFDNFYGRSMGTAIKHFINWLVVTGASLRVKDFHNNLTLWQNINHEDLEFSDKNDDDSKKIKVFITNLLNSRDIKEDFVDDILDNLSLFGNDSKNINYTKKNIVKFIKWWDLNGDESLDVVNDFPKWRKSGWYYTT